MATLPSLVELSTSRNSYHQVESVGDIKDPQWIPVLRKPESSYNTSQEKELSPYTSASFSPMPTYTVNSSQHVSKPSSLHSYSRSSVAPETVELEATSLPRPVPVPPLPRILQQTSRQMNFELPATRPTSRYFEKAPPTGTPGDATLASTDTETSVDFSRSESNADTSTTTDDAASVQTPVAVKEETPSQAPVAVKEETPSQAPVAVKEETPSQAPVAVKEDTPSIHQPSLRSSLTSTKKYSIGPPTSKFNRKPKPTFPSKMTSLQSQVSRPSTAPSSKSTPAHSCVQTPLPSPRLAETQTQPASQKPSPSTPSKKASPLRLKPSNASLASHSSSGSPAPLAAPTATRETQQPDDRQQKSIASVRSQQAKSDMKAPSPSLPPAIATEHKGRGNLAGEGQPLPVTETPETPRIEKPETARLADSPTLGPSSGISSFMTVNDTVIFRRFDEVHIQLLLCLQDEIAQLEREMIKLESAVMTRSDRDIERSRVIRELRKVVAEYGKFWTPLTS